MEIGHVAKYYYWDAESLSFKNQMTELVPPLRGFRSLPNPTDSDLQDAEFEVLWQVVKKWDINVPEYYDGYCGGNGSHVMLLLTALRETRGR